MYAEALWRHAALAVAAVAAALLVPACGADEAATSPAPSRHAPRSTATAAPTSPGYVNPPSVTPPRPGSLRALKERCFAATQALEEVYLTYPTPFAVPESETRRFTVRLVQDPEWTGRGGETVQGHLKVACTVQARLVTVDDEVSAADHDWITQRYVPPEETRWTWVVSGRQPGTSEAVLQLKPVVRITHEDGKVADEELGTQSFDVTFRVSRSASNWLSSTGAAVVAVAGGVSVVAGAVVVLRKLLERKSSADAG